MAHFAEIDENGIVQRTIVVDNNDCGGGQYPQSESIGQQYIAGLGLTGDWKQTSYSGSFRKQFAGPGHSYDLNADIFISPQPFPSWTLDANHDWQPPTPPPSEGGPWRWDEEALGWVEYTA